ncbi:Uncharacterised protein [Mycobacterium tuberculosis]|nr:Uncharacterised protein [Mycobacterium tuberculosis]
MTVSTSVTRFRTAYASGSCGLSLSPWPRWSSASTRYPALVSSRTHPVSTQLSRAPEAKPCTATTTGASSSPQVYVASRVPSAA